MSGPKPRSIADAWKHLLQQAVVTENYCWLITSGRPVGIGYRRIRADHKDWYIHALADFVERGLAPKGTVLRHTCDRPNCFNPKHILRGSHADNIADKVSKKRHCFGEKHYRSKLSAEQVAEIRASSQTTTELSLIYGISRGGIHNIRNGRSWQT